MKILNLCTLAGFPPFFFEEMEKHTELLLNTESSDELIENPVFQELIERLTEFSKDCNIVGYHYTRANKEDFLKEGLKSRSGQEIREIFLSRYSVLFTVEELETIKKLWDAYFDKIQKSSRDNYIFFNLTTEALSNSGAEPLLKYYGGEQVYMPLQREFTIAQKLRGIGTPLLIKAILDPKQLSNFYEDDIVKIAISSYHRNKKTDADQYDRDVYQRRPILSNQIEITNLKD
ncbi:hypothetical protein SAMN05720469_12316 [Fibrobacter intestinalis]|uniref:Uncharacterized protein n=1 Tax=Fibrobacter intestinalis TaxID=28122 RepID=A0A1M6WBM8_9BACT|nr:hypothetical protein [Fibrobacter intestinalis]SHK91101.1 hypothetical protein SAMN05720469_12316 [Fibrobacter intestinalis]